MLADARLIPTLPARDIERAKRFYEQVLGLQAAHVNDEGAMYALNSGNQLFVYRSEFAGTNMATYLSWAVEDIEAEMQALRDHGVTFEEYIFPGGYKTVNGIMEMQGNKAAWFKDTEGNIHALEQGSASD